MSVIIIIISHTLRHKRLLSFSLWLGHGWWWYIHIVYSCMAFFFVMFCMSPFFFHVEGRCKDIYTLKTIRSSVKSTVRQYQINIKKSKTHTHSHTMPNNSINKRSVDTTVWIVWIFLQLLHSFFKDYFFYRIFKYITHTQNILYLQHTIVNNSCIQKLVFHFRNEQFLSEEEKNHTQNRFSISVLLLKFSRSLLMPFIYYTSAYKKKHTQQIHRHRACALIARVDDVKVRLKAKIKILQHFLFFFVAVLFFFCFISFIKHII